MILKVNSPTSEEIQMIKDGSSYLSFFQTMKENADKVTKLLLNVIPKINE